MLHVLVGASCNNNCIFCMESDRDGRQRHVGSQSDGDIRRMIESYPFKDEILFTSGEPTLNEALPQYLAWARDAGFETIGVISNARRIAYRDYAHRLVQSGMNKITVSIHGHTEKLHNGLSRTPGSFDQTVEGLKNLSELKEGHGRARPVSAGGGVRRGGLEIHTSTVVVRRNLEHLAEIYRFLESFGVDRLCFNIMMIKGRGLGGFERLMPRYGEIARMLSDLAETVPVDQGRHISVADIPRCTVPGLEFELIGDQERFEQFEILGSNGIAWLSREELEAMGDSARAEGRAKELGAVEELSGRVDGAAELCGDEAYYLTTRELKDNVLRAKRDECKLCTHTSRCPGVWQVYVDRYGWDEFAPVKDKS